MIDIVFFHIMSDLGFLISYESLLYICENDVMIRKLLNEIIHYNNHLVFVCVISLTSGQLIIELFPDCTRSCFSQVVLRRRGGDRIFEMRCLFVAVGPNARL